MTVPIRREWSLTDDNRLLAMRAEGMEWSALALAFHATRNSVIARHNRILRRRGLARGPAIGGEKRRHSAGPAERKEPLPPGHPVTWGAITAGTLLEGSPYPEAPRWWGT